MTQFPRSQVVAATGNRRRRGGGWGVDEGAGIPSMGMVTSGWIRPAQLPLSEICEPRRNRDGVQKRS